MSKITCFGEVLWDVFPTHKKIVGAPLNVALRLHSFKNAVTIISSIGNDKNGEKLKHYIKQQGLAVDYIQTNTTYETSKVEVILDEKGSASYTIKFPCSWDYIYLNSSLIPLVKESDAFIFGSLVSRNPQSEDALKKLLSESSFSVFDVNLRPPHYKIGTLINFMNIAHFIKFNDDELLEISTELGSKHSNIEENIKYISELTNTKKICVTRGSNGAVLFYKEAFFYNSGYPVTVADTVGSGDSFLATLIDSLLRKEKTQKAIDTACAVGALVAQNNGANPKILKEDIENLIERSL